MWEKCARCGQKGNAFGQWVSLNRLEVGVSDSQLREFSAFILIQVGLCFRESSLSFLGTTMVEKTLTRRSLLSGVSFSWAGTTAVPSTLAVMLEAVTPVTISVRYFLLSLRHSLLDHLAAR